MAGKRGVKPEGEERRNAFGEPTISPARPPVVGFSFCSHPRGTRKKQQTCSPFTKPCKVATVFDVLSNVVSRLRLHIIDGWLRSAMWRKVSSISFPSRANPRKIGGRQECGGRPLTHVARSGFTVPRRGRWRERILSPLPRIIPMWDEVHRNLWPRSLQRPCTLRRMEERGEGRSETFNKKGIRN